MRETERQTDRQIFFNESGIFGVYIITRIIHYIIHTLKLVNADSDTIIYKDGISLSSVHEPTLLNKNYFNNAMLINQHVQFAF